MGKQVQQNPGANPLDTTKSQHNPSIKNSFNTNPANTNTQSN
jgi:hypothetical protein